MYKKSYTIDLEDVIKNLNSEDICVLDYLNSHNTDMFSGINIKDMLEDEAIIGLGLKHSKLYSMLDKLKLVNAIGAKVSGKFYSYYIKDIGKDILEYLDTI